MFDARGAAAGGLQRLAAQPLIRVDLAHLVSDLPVCVPKKGAIDFSDKMRSAGEFAL